MSDRQTLTRAEWQARAVELFGSDPLAWRFVCPSCGHEAAVSAWRDAGAPEGAVAFSCVGRWLEGTPDDRAFRGAGGPCTYAGGGLFRLNPTCVVDLDGKEHDVFAFATKDEKKRRSSTKGEPTLELRGVRARGRTGA